MFSMFENKRVLVTGHTGFKGGWLALWLKKLDAHVYGYSLPPPTEPSNYVLSNLAAVLEGEWIGDIRDREQIKYAVEQCAPDVIFHLAAQPLVRYSYREPFETYDVNVMGTASVLDAVRHMKKKCAVVCITTDKCYENREHGEGFSEEDPMGGYDPYSASKGAAELLISSYRRSFFHPEKLNEHGVQLASVRAGNVIGGGDFAEDRIVVDLVKSIRAGQLLPIRNPQAIRPWQHVLEPLSGYLTLVAKMLGAPSPQWCSGWNFGPERESEQAVSSLADAFFSAWGAGGWLDCSGAEHVHEAKVLKLKIEKAKRELGWSPRWDFQTMVDRTVAWYRNMDTHAAQDLCLADIEAYSQPLMSNKEMDGSL